MTTRDLSSWSGHVILCGLGRVGGAVAEELARRGAAFLAIDRDAAACARAAERGWPVLHGDAASHALLEQARIQAARGLVAATGSDATNTFVTLSARALNRGLYIVARADDLDSTPKLHQAGADHVISPTLIAGRRLAFAALYPSLLDFTETLTSGPAEAEALAQLDVQPGSEWEGRTLRDVLAEAEGVAVLGLRHRDGRLRAGPSAEHVLRAGDAIMVLGPSLAIEAVSSACTAPAPMA